MKFKEEETKNIVFIMSKNLYLLCEVTMINN